MKRLENDSNWNSLFLNPNSVMAAMSKKYDVEKRDILE